MAPRRNNGCSCTQISWTYIQIFLYLGTNTSVQKSKYVCTKSNFLYKGPDFLYKSPNFLYKSPKFLYKVQIFCTKVQILCTNLSGVQIIWTLYKSKKRTTQLVEVQINWTSRYKLDLELRNVQSPNPEVQITEKLAWPPPD